MMPSLSHWPNRPLPFRWKDSEVIAHIQHLAQCDIKEAERIFDRAKRKKVILFDDSQLTWAGNPAWIPWVRKRRRKMNFKS
jgi:hypothetical protein